MFFPLSAIGFASMIAQILVLRELVIVFNGNELTYGLSIMIWLIFTGLGSYISGKFALKDERMIIYVEIAASLIIPVEILFARFSKLLLNIPTGVLPDLNSIVLISAVSIMPMCVIYGSLFTIGSRTMNGIGKMYTAESLGAVIGGAVLSFILIYHLNAFQAAGIAGAVIAFSAIYFYKNFISYKVSVRTSGLVVFSLAIALNMLLIHPYGAKLDRVSLKAQFQGLNLIRSIDTIYGRISVIEDKGEKSYFEDGYLAFSTASSPQNEEMVHLSFLESAAPKNVLLIGGGPASIPEIIKHKPVHLDYIESDPELSEAAIATDGRYFIKKTKGSYDLIIINIGDPNSSALNRFYTIEFFRECIEKLSPDGVLSLKISGSPDFMSAELRRMNSSISKTLASAFHYVRVVPGAYNYYFASKGAGIISDDADILIKRWGEMQVSTKYFDAKLIPHILKEEKLGYVKEAVKYDGSTPINSDSRPITYLYSILIWLSFFPGFFSAAAQKLLSIKLAHLLIVLFAAGSCVKIAGCRSKRVNEAIIPLIVALVGASAMIAQLLLLYSFQAVYGNIYYMIGILTAIFMGGLAAGSHIANAKFKDIGVKPVVLMLLISIVLFGLYLNAVTMFDFRASKYVIPAFSFLFACLTGGFFPIAAGNFMSKTIENKAGVLYGADLLGGAASALLTSLLFMPVYGIYGTIAVAGSLYLISLILAR